MTKEAQSKSIPFTHNIVHRVSPDYYQWSSKIADYSLDSIVIVWSIQYCCLRKGSTNVNDAFGWKMAEGVQTERILKSWGANCQ
ncbi:hypothetical protein AgCh_037781 [Apium graveolens]